MSSINCCAAQGTRAERDILPDRPRGRKETASREEEEEGGGEEEEAGDEEEVTDDISDEGVGCNEREGETCVGACCSCSRCCWPLQIKMESEATGRWDGSRARRKARRSEMKEDEDENAGEDDDVDDGQDVEEDSSSRGWCRFCVALPCWV